MSRKIEHDKDNAVFFIKVDGKTAFLKYFFFTDKGILDYQHTFVPPELRGQRIASEIVKVALDYAKKNNYKVIPTCSFVGRYIQEHPEYGNLVAKNN